MGRMLAGALASAGPEAHDCYWGPTDASGLAALGLNEVLLLTMDVTRGLGERCTPSAPLCAAVLDRLFPAAPLPMTWWTSCSGPGTERNCQGTHRSPSRRSGPLSDNRVHAVHHVLDGLAANRPAEVLDDPRHQACHRLRRASGDMGRQEDP